MLAPVHTLSTTHHKLLPDVTSPAYIEFDDSMTTRNTCPCCSYSLLRHISRSRVYWHCSHCHAPMSAWRYVE